MATTQTNKILQNLTNGSLMEREIIIQYQKHLQL